MESVKELVQESGNPNILLDYPDGIKAWYNGGINCRTLGIKFSEDGLTKLKKAPLTVYSISFDWRTDAAAGRFKIQLAGAPWDNLTGYIEIDVNNREGHYENLYTSSDQIVNFMSDELQIRADEVHGDLNIYNLKLEEYEKPAEPKKLAIIGACCSRDMCNHNFVSNYKDYFDIVYYAFQTSFISLMSKPVPYNRDLISFEGKNFNAWYRDILVGELNKSFCNDLLSLQPDNLLIDFYSDVVMGVLEISGGESYISQRIKDQENNAAFKLISRSRELMPIINREEYLALFEKGLKRFFDFMKLYLPQTNIMLNVPHFTDKIKNKDGTIGIFHEKNVALYNDIYAAMVDIAKKTSDKLIVIDLGKEYYIDPEYIFGGAWIVHFMKDYYEDLIREVYKNSQSRTVPSKQNTMQLYAFNLILNHDLQNGTLFYKYWDNIFRIDPDNNSIYVNERDHSGNIYRILLSADIAVDPDAEYLISFECLVSSEVELSSDVIFVARSFNKPNMGRKADAADNMEIPWNNKYDIWCEYTRVYKPKGKYMSFGCCCAKNGMISWKNIMLHRLTEGVTKNSKNIIEILHEKNIDVLNDVNRIELYKN